MVVVIVVLGADDGQQHDGEDGENVREAHHGVLVGLELGNCLREHNGNTPLPRHRHHHGQIQRLADLGCVATRAGPNGAVSSSEQCISS